MVPIASAACNPVGETRSTHESAARSVSWMTFSTPAFPEAAKRAGLGGDASSRLILDIGKAGVPSWVFPTGCAHLRSVPICSRPHDDAIRRVDEMPASSMCGIAMPQASCPVVPSGVPWPILATR